jgi:hypothetical protein
VTVAVEAPLKVNVAPLAIDDGVAVPEMLYTGATTLNENVLEVALAVAVKVAVWFVETDATVAVKAAVEAPAATETVAGTVTLVLLLASATLSPPAGATPLRPTLQEEVPGAVTLAGLQVRLVTVGEGKLMVIVPPVPVPGIETLFAFAAETAASCTAVAAFSVPGAMVN